MSDEFDITKHKWSHVAYCDPIDDNLLIGSTFVYKEDAIAIAKH